ncbi:MAG: hypothetical protein GC192_05415 [Bacteroidetes bacterium]|nr:hypothetical protein [Bacteroidota bacterium]
MKSTKLILAGCLIFMLPIVSFSQKFWEISASPGLMNYYGDLTPPLFTVKEVNFGGQLSVRRYFDREHAIRVNILHGKLAGDDHNFDRNYLRGNSFEGRLTEFAVMGEIDFKGRKRFSTRHGYEKMASLYLFAGGSVAYFDPTVHYGNPDSKDKDIDYIKWHIGMPIGGGVKIDVNEKLVIGLELSYRFTISDFLDGTQASGNTYKNDSYTFGGVSVGYRLFDKMKVAEESTQK